MLLFSGCSHISKESSNMTSEEEQRVKDSAVQYIKKTYNKELVIKDITKGRVVGDYSIHGTIKDGKDTPVYVGVGVNSPDGDGFDDSYVNQLFTTELEPHIQKIAQHTFDLRQMRDGFSYGYRDKIKRKYTSEIPSVWEVLKKGDKDFRLRLTLEVYQQVGQVEVSISKFIQELKKMNFNEVGLTVFVYDGSLKSRSDKKDADDYRMQRYGLHGDIQTMDVNNLKLDKMEFKK